MKYEKICLLSEYSAEFEAFCHRNGIPYFRSGRNIHECIYLVRPGIDHTDALIMIYKMGWNYECTMDLNTINNLVMDHIYHEPKYKYEFYPHQRKDEAILNAFTNTLILFSSILE